MTDQSQVSPVEEDCDSRCAMEFVACMDAEDEALICKTRERNCQGECSL